MECDDMNSLIHLCLYLNELDVEGIIYTASQYHFLGDGVHTLGEVTPNYRCHGMLEIEGHLGTRHPDPEAKSLKSYRPFEKGWIENLFRKEYAQAYPFLSSNAEGFPTPEEMISRVCYGNCDFEGDVRFESEGSGRIEQAIMDERTDPLYLQSWGGANTIVRALKSIWEKHGASPEWENICRKVVSKVRILGIMGRIGQDNSFLDEKIPELFPGIVCLFADYNYASFLTAATAQPDLLPMMKGSYMYPHFKTGHGSLMAKYGLYGDGIIYEGEADRYQYGLRPTLEWSFDNFPVFHFNRFDMLGEGDSYCYIPLLSFGLRGLEDPRYGTVLGILREDTGDPAQMGELIKRMRNPAAFPNPFLKAYHEDFAARAEWCVKGYEECNHSPVVRIGQPNVEAAPGERVTVSAVVEDVRPCIRKWWLYEDGCRYQGDLSQADHLGSIFDETEFTVPQDARPGDFFNLILTVQNADVNPMTEYGQIIVHVK